MDGFDQTASREFSGIWAGGRRGPANGSVGTGAGCRAASFDIAAVKQCGHGTSNGIRWVQRVIAASKLGLRFAFVTGAARAKGIHLNKPTFLGK